MTQLASIPDIIKSAKKIGVTFGHGDPRTHLAYLSKLRLLPQAIRRKINGSDHVVGCYPETVVPLLKKIEELKEAGLTYSQIRYKLSENNLSLPALSENEYAGPSVSTPIYNQAFAYQQRSYSYPTTLAFLIIGLFLGYIVSMLNSQQTNMQNPLAVKPVQAEETHSTIDPMSSDMIRIIESSKEEDGNQSQIYVISVPRGEHFSKLEQTNINQLFNK